MHHRSRTPRTLGIAIAAVLSLGLGAQPVLAAPAAAPTADQDPVPGLVAGSETAAPQLVTGLAEPAAGADPVAAARAHLAAHQDRYRVDPAQLAEAGTEQAADGRRTVKFEQWHGGVPVFGSKYLVHLVGDGAAQKVESVGGKYFTGLTVPTTATVPDEALRGLALGSVKDPKAQAGLTAEDHGLVVLPGGAGRLARHFTVRGTDPAAWASQAREVFVDATVGEVALDYTVRAPAQAPAAGPAGAEPATGTAVDALGRPAKVNLGRLPDGSYQLTDLTRAASITTYDAAGRDENVFARGIPADVHPVSSPTADFPAAAGTNGAVDAHVNAGAVYDFYRDRLGREGLDGKAGPIVSVVNTTAFGEPRPNAFWDGKKMIYGGGTAKYNPFAVALDVAGHEMTHGVVQHTAAFATLGQSGAMDEAFADYFGNAIEVTTRGLSMTDPRAALLGESLCRTGTPEACATRRLDDRRTTVNDYLGAPIGVDNGGVHANSTIFSGALWDVRRALDPLTADRLVYRALAEYLTPLDDFVDARNAVLAAGKAIGLSKAELRTVAGAFDAHGIKAGWERRIGVDSRPLLRELAGASVAPDVAKGRWVASGTERGGSGSLTLYSGAVNGSGAPTRLSPDDHRSHGWAATDGTGAAWLATGSDEQGRWAAEVLTRPLADGTPRSVYKGVSQQVADVRIAGGDIAFRVLDFATGRNSLLLSHDGGPAAEVPLAAGHRARDLSVRNGLLAWTETWSAGEKEMSAPTVYSIATGKVVAQYVAGGAAGGIEAGETRLVDGRLLWVETPEDRKTGSSIRSGALDGSGVTEVLPAGPGAPRVINRLTASDQAVTFAYAPDFRIDNPTNADLPKLWQVPVTGGTPVRVSCNRGGQYEPAADQGTRVIWLDATAGRTDLVVRERPAGTC